MEAARLAFMDGIVSHHNNGVLGEVFNAVLTSLPYVCNDVRQIVFDTIYCFIPDKSEYFSAVDYAYGLCKTNSSWREAWRKAVDKYKMYNWIHAYPNACAEVIAMYYGNGDFDETMHIMAMMGYDVDCNAAQVATVLGVIGKQDTMKEHWTKPIGDRLDTYVRANKVMSISGLAEYTVRLAREKKL